MQTTPCFFVRGIWEILELQSKFYETLNSSQVSVSILANVALGLQYSPLDFGRRGCYTRMLNWEWEAVLFGDQRGGELQKCILLG